jgi:hypothetical protein
VCAGKKLDGSCLAQGQRRGERPFAPTAITSSEHKPIRSERPITGRFFVDERLDLYVDFVILEERVQGNLPAVEGIRIVKERKPAGE